ncbi:MAG: VWA domain-containing protein [Acidobacteriaceae bacterium]|nr:VWA domain-containing protein [Acidobacteriaceae bacterium]
MRRAFPALLFAVLKLMAQQVGQNAPFTANQPANFTAGTQLVIETVSVTDKQGHPVEGLTAKDFAITENSAVQDIRFFEQQTLPESPMAASAPQDPKDIHIYDKLGRTEIAAEQPGSPRYKDRRLLVLYFDMTAMPPADQLRALNAAVKFVRTQMIAADMVAILRYSGGSLDVLQDFTADRGRLVSILETMIVGEGQGLDESTADASTPDVGAAFGQDDSEFNIFNTDRQLSALQTAAQLLSQISERKSLVYFASGLRLNGLDNQAQLHATINAAIRAGVTFWPIDARGLSAAAPLGDATQGSPGSIGMYSGTAAVALTSNIQRSQDTLYALASDTGGKALFDFNDLTRGIVEAARAISSYYVLGYYRSNSALDGKFRRIKISLISDLNAHLDYRQGYFAPKSFSKSTAADKERQLEDALMLPDPITELTIAMEIDFFQLNRAEYFVPVIVKIPGRELALAKRRGAERTLIDLIGEVKDNYGSTISNVRDRVNIKLSDPTAAELARRPIEYDTGFTLLPGKYILKLLARDAETGRIGTYQTNFVIPNLNKENKRIAISSVVLSSQRVNVKDALYSAKDKEKAEAVNPLVENGQKLIPSVTRVFHRNRDIYVYVQAYQQEALAARPLLAFVSFYRDRAKAFETQPIEVKTAADNRLKTMALQFSIPLHTLTAGEYDCQITILNPDEKKAAFWRAPVMVIE